MKLLFDESAPVQLRSLFVGHWHLDDMGLWGGTARAMTNVLPWISLQRGCHAQDI